MYHGQSSETTDGSLNARVERLPWINEHVAALIGKRAEDGRKLIGSLHMGLLGYLALTLPGRAGKIVRADLIDFFEDQHRNTPRRLLCDLRRLGLIEYLSNRTELDIWVASPPVAQPTLAMPGFDHRIPAYSSNPVSTDSMVESRSANSDSLLGSGTCLFEIATNQRAHTRAHGEGLSSGERLPNAPGERLPDFLDGRIACHVLPRLKAIRLHITGRQRLSLGEIESLKALFASGVTLAEFEQAVESTLHTRAAKGVKTRIAGLAYFIPEAEEIHRGNLADEAFLAPVAPTTTETPNDAGTNGRRDPRSTNGVAQATRPAGGARVANGRRAAPERRQSPISEEQERDRQRQTDEALRRYLRPMADR